MSTAKVSVTIDEDLIAAAKIRAGERGLSGYLNDALKHQLQRDRAIEFLEAMDTEYGPIDSDVMEEVRREWPNAGNSHTRRSA
jgi:hypothetical protein